MSQKTKTEREITADDIVLPVKRTTGETLRERMTKNAYENILPARYLQKDADGQIVESQEELFDRVAKNIALAEAVYEARNRDLEITVQPHQIKPNHPRRNELTEEVFGLGVTVDDDAETTLTEANVNKFAYDTIVPALPDEVRKHVEAVANLFRGFMEDLSFTPNSPTLMNAGKELQQLSACFVDSPGDDLTDIHETMREAAEVFQSGGGMGYGFWKLRPYGDPVGSTGGIASGPITFMRTFDQMCETIAQGGTRRGAQMAVMKVTHPDVIQFIHAKNKDVSLAHTLRLNDPDDYTHTKFSDALEEARELLDEDGRVPKHLRNAVEGHLSNFNISVGVTDDFMEALYDDAEFTFINPRTEEPHIATPETKELYEMFDLGEHVTVGEVLRMPARLLWERIVEGAWENGEPGVIYLERVNKEHSFDVEEHPDHEILATNPCGEQPLEEYEACNLGHINLSTLADLDAPDWRVWNREHDDEFGSLEEAMDAYLQDALDVEELERRVDLGTRFLENVVTMSDFPVKAIERKVREMRKIGLGVMGLAQLYVQLGIPYGSDAGNELARQVMMRINHRSKWASHELAEERGSFADWADSKYADPVRYRDWFEHQTGLSADAWADGFPIRNHNTTTIAPTGTTSMIANTTGGCEPIFSVAYYKNVSDDVQGDEMLVEFDDYFLRVLEANDIDVETVKAEALEQMQANEFDGIRGLTTVPDAIGELFVVTSDLSGKDHAAVQCACQQGVDSAISKTCNFPNSATREDMDEVYRYIYDHGGKGVTVYRDGTRSKQVLTTRAKNTSFSDEEEAATVLATNLKEVFGGLQGFLDSPEAQEALGEEAKKALVRLENGQTQQQTGTGLANASSTAGQVEPRARPDVVMGTTQKVETGYGSLYVTINKDDQGLFEVFATIGRSGGYTASFTEGLARMVSLALRSGIPVDAVVDQLEGIRSPKIAFDHGEKVMSVPDALALALKREQGGELYKSIQARVDTFQVDDEPEVNGAEGALPSTEVEVQTDTEQEKELADPKDQEVRTLVRAGVNPECPECNAMLTLQEGCVKCMSCGYSEC